MACCREPGALWWCRVAELANALWLYGRFIGLSIQAQLQYRLSFVLMAFGNFVTSVVEAIGVWALFDRFGMLQQWSLPQVAFLYGLINCVFPVSEALARGFDIFGKEFVKTGNFDRSHSKQSFSLFWLIY